MSDSSYEVGAPPPRRRRGSVSPLIASSRTPTQQQEVAPAPAEQQQQQLSPDAAAEVQPPAVPAAESPAADTGALTTAEEPVVGIRDGGVAAQVAPVEQQPAPVVAPMPTPVPAVELQPEVPSAASTPKKAESATWKKTIAFPVDLWRYAGTVHNATADLEDELYFQEFVWAALRREIERREREYNNGVQFQAPSRLRRGRRFGE